MIVIDYQDRRPLYEQIVEKFRILILKNALPPGARMPSVRQLAMDLSINPNTIQRAYMELEQQGLIYPVKGKGNFVADAQQIREQSKKLYQEELDNLIRRGADLGISEKEMLDTVRESYRKMNFYRTKPANAEMSGKDSEAAAKSGNRGSEQRKTETAPDSSTGEKEAKS